MRVISGEVFDVAVDIRPSSPTWGMHYSVILSGEIQNQLYIPPGFAHGFVVVSETALVAYKCTEFYHPADEGGIRWNDPELGIGWPLKNVLVSSKDAVLPFLKDLA